MAVLSDSSDSSSDDDDDVVEVVEDVNPPKSKKSKPAPKPAPKKKKKQSIGHTPEVLALYDWLVLMIEDNVPLTAVRKNSYRRFSKHSVYISYERIVAMLFALEEEVIGKVKVEMKGKKGILVHDGWTRNGVHYMATYAVYCDEEQDNKLCIVLLGSGPIYEMPTESLVDSSDDEDDETPLSSLAPEEKEDGPGYATRFTAEVLRHHLGATLEQFDFTNIKDFALGQVADSVAVNIRLADIIEYAHFPCLNHCLQLDMKDEEKINKTRLGRTMQRVRKIVKEVKGSVKNMAVLHNITPLRPKSTETFKWKEKASTLARFTELFDSIREAHEHEDSKFSFGGSTVDHSFKKDCKRFSSELADISRVVAKLETEGLARNEGQSVIDMFFKKMDKLSDKEDTGKKFHGNCYKQSHSKVGNKHEGSRGQHNFANSGILKVQGGDEAHLNRDEKRAMKGFLLPVQEEKDSDSSDGNSDDSEELDMTKLLEEKSEEMKNKRKRRKSKYVCCDFVLASAAIVERLWSKADAILTQRRQGLNPQVVESLLFLKENRQYWTIEQVADALKNVQSKEKSDRLKKKLEQDAFSEKMGKLNEIC